MSKKNILIDLILNLLITLSVFFAVILFLIINKSPKISQAELCFRYFTNDSNILMALISLIWSGELFASYKNPNHKIPKWICILKFVGTTSVALTFFTVLFFLAPVAVASEGFLKFFWFYAESNFVLHFAAPLLSMISFIFFCSQFNLKTKHCFFTLIPPFIYSLVYLILVVFLKRWPDFYNFTFGGHYYLSPVIMVAIYSSTFAMSFLLRILNKKVFKNQ